MAIATTLALTEQFLTSLAPDANHTVPETGAEAPSPLVLLDAAAKSLKAQVTKVSLLTINTPFTPSAVATSLQAVNDSVLPSLMTATLLSTPDVFTTSFSKEIKGLTRALLRELLALVRLVEARSKDGRPTAALTEPKKSEVTEATGRVWEACDSLVKLSELGVPGFVARKAKQWLELMKDAVKELQEWDPEEEVDDDLFGDGASDDDEEQPQAVDGNKDTADDRATISAGVKDQALKVLSRIPQSVHVLVKQRLEKFRPTVSAELPVATRKTLEDILSGTRRISDMIDESAEGMYMGDLELCLKKAGEARALTIEIVQAALDPLDKTTSGTALSETQEDKFIKRALEWIRQVDTGTVK